MGITQEQAKKLQEQGEQICFKHKGQTICADIKRVNENTITIQTPTLKGRVPLSWAVPKSAWKEEYVSKRQQYQATSTPKSEQNYQQSKEATIPPIPNTKLSAFQMTVNSMASCMDQMRIIREQCNDLTSAKCSFQFEPARECAEKNAQKLLVQLNQQYNLPLNKIYVDGTRKNARQGEKYGFYNVGTTNITVYPYTKAREEVVANKTILQTIVHEWVHHYDETGLKINSIHSSGFYQRVNTIDNQLKTILK